MYGNDLCRFQQGYCRHNPRKMVRTWAEKETRNLHRLCRAGVACPEPVYHKDHIVVMSFIGEHGRYSSRSCIVVLFLFGSYLSFGPQLGSNDFI